MISVNVNSGPLASGKCRRAADTGDPDPNPYDCAGGGAERLAGAAPGGDLPQPPPRRAVTFGAGGNVGGDRVHGRWPGLAPSAPAYGDLAITTDYRDVLAEILTRCPRSPNIGAVFPGHTPRPVGVVR